MAKNSVHRLVDSQAAPLTIARLFGVANTAGGSAGASVSTAVSFVDRYGAGLLPSAGYAVQVMPSQLCFATVTQRTANGFNVVLTPQNSSTTLAAGSFDVTVIA
jgi:hypothetical protein